MPTGLSAEEILHRQFLARRVQNPSYSLRAFSRDLGLSVGGLSEILNKKRRLSAALALSIYPHLQLDKNEQKVFLKEPLKRRNRKTYKETFSKLSSDEFSLVAEWYHFAIVNLLQVEGARVEPNWISGRLNLPVRTVKVAIRRLLNLGILERKDGKLCLSKVKRRLSTTHDIASEAIRLHHRQILDRAIDELCVGSIAHRDITSICLAFDSKKLPEAKKELRSFRRRFARLFSEGKKDRVFTLAMQFFPLDKGGTK